MWSNSTNLVCSVIVLLHDTEQTNGNLGFPGNNSLILQHLDLFPVPLEKDYAIETGLKLGFNCCEHIISSISLYTIM